jgi:hypothetical protein
MNMVQVYNSTSLLYIKWSPDLLCHTLLSYVLTPKILTQVCKRVHIMLNMSASCWHPTINSSHLAILSKFWGKAPLKKLRNLSLSLSKDAWWQLGLNATGIMAFEDTDSNKLQAATTWQWNMKMFACYEEILKVKMRSVSHNTSVLDFFKLFSGTHACLPTLEMMIQMSCLHFKSKCLLLTMSLLDFTFLL